MIASRNASVLLTVSVLAGCGRVPLPSGGPAPLVAVAEASYPVRQDLLATTVPTGTPPHWPTPGYPPLRSLKLGARSMDVDFATQLRPALGRTILDPQTALNAAQRDNLGRALENFFGTSAAPGVRLPAYDATTALAFYDVNRRKGVFYNLEVVYGRVHDWNEAAETVRELNLTEPALARGSVLYRRWCMSCHGETGAGDGSHAIQIGAIPRDYRQGTFKFVSAFPQEEQPRKGVKGKPLKADLKRTIRHGLDGSMMPAFPQFSDTELDDLASYVIHLSIRGEVEYETMIRAIQLLTNPSDEDPDYTPEVMQQTMDLNTILVVGNWGRAGHSAIPIPPSECPTEELRMESAVRGYKAFSLRGCLGCHDNYGRTQQLKYDAWGTVVQPRNLMLGIYRGGRRGEDLYARIYGGIVPSTMPDYTPNLKLNPSIPGKTDEIWDIVHFLQTLPDPRGRRELADRLHREKRTNPGLNVIPFD